MEEQEQTTLKFSKPAYIKLETETGQSVSIDVYKARKILELSDKQPSEEAKWEYINKWLKEQLTIPEGVDLAWNQLLEFNDLVVKLVIKLNEERLGKTEGILSSQQPIQVSPMIIENGQ